MLLTPIRTALSGGDLLLEVRADDISAISRVMVDHLIDVGRLEPEHRAPVLAALAIREAQGSTALGHALAIPHAYIPDLPEPQVLFARLHRPQNLDAPDGIPVRFIFLLLGPLDRAGEHLEALASIARLMADDAFRYDARLAHTADDIASAFGSFEARQAARKRPLSVPHATSKDSSEDDPLSFTGKLFGGLRADLRRRLPYYFADLRDGVHPKALGSVLFLLFAALAPAITFGGIMADQTGNMIGATEMLLATAICGITYALFGGMPLIILGGTGPLLVITAILYGACQRLGLPFFATYFWVGLWTGFFCVVAAALDLSAWMKRFTRFTDEIFAALIALIFIYEATAALISPFHDDHGHHEAAFFAVILAIGCFWIAHTLFRFRRSVYLKSKVRELLADFGPAIAIFMMTVLATLFPDVALESMSAPDTFAPTADRPWLVDPFAAPTWVWAAAALPAAFVAILVYLDQNITARLVNNPDNRLKRGAAYHLDLAIVGGLIALCSAFGLPWLVAATVRSINHVRSLATIEEVITPSGEAQEHIVHVRENRLTGLAIHGLLGLSLLALPLLRTVPMAVLYGLFLYMGIASARGSQFFARLALWPMDRGLYPRTHYLRSVPVAKVHLFTAVQLVSLVVLWAVKVSVIGLLFPVFIGLLVPLRAHLDRYFKPEHLMALDSEESPEVKREEHWL